MGIDASFLIQVSTSLLHECHIINWLFFFSECGVKDPSWVELNHFLKFLDIQLSSCEKSIFCNEDLVGDVMSGLKTFVVKFMIRMSKVNTQFAQ